MIELIIAERCTACDRCDEVCPSNVFEPTETGLPVVARQDDCQTCFMCEFYCTADALYVGPNADHREPVDSTALVASGLLGQYRCDPGWDEWRERYPNEQWLMETVFRRAAEAAR